MQPFSFLNGVALAQLVAFVSASPYFLEGDGYGVIFARHPEPKLDYDFHFDLLARNAEAEAKPEADAYYENQDDLHAFYRRELDARDDIIGHLLVARTPGGLSSLFGKKNKNPYGQGSGNNPADFNNPMQPPVKTSSDNLIVQHPPPGTPTPMGPPGGPFNKQTQTDGPSTGVGGGPVKPNYRDQGTGASPPPPGPGTAPPAAGGGWTTFPNVTPPPRVPGPAPPGTPPSTSNEMSWVPPSPPPRPPGPVGGQRPIRRRR